MKKVIALIMTTLMLTATLAGCGPKKSTPGNAPSGDGKDGETRTITWMTTRASWPAMEDLAAEYNAAHPNVKVEFNKISDPASYYQKLTILAANNELPDLFDSEADSLFKEIASQTEMADVDELYKELGYEDASPIALNYARMDDGKLYHMAWENNIEYFWYHKDLFKKAGIEKAPETFDELLEVCKKLKDAGITPIATFPNWEAIRWMSFMPYRLAGNDFIEKLKVGDAKMSDPVGMQSAQYFQELASNYFQPGWATGDYTNALETFLSSNAAIYYIGSWQFSSFVDPETQELKEDYDFFYMPTLDGAVNGKTDMWAHAGTGTAVRKDKLDDDLKDFLKFVLDNFPERAGLVTPADSGKLSNFYQQVLDDTMGLTDYGYCWDVRVDSATKEVLTTEIVNLGMGAITPEEFATRIDTAIAENAPKAFGK